MICNRCLRAAQRITLSSARPTLHLRPHTRTNASTAAPRQGSPTSSHTPPAATSAPGVSQPFSAPLTPSAKNQDIPTGKTTAAPAVPKSSVPAGTVLKGLNFMKNKQDPVALEDAAYPDWLWGVLAAKEGASKEAEVEGDLFCRFSLVQLVPPLPSLPRARLEGVKVKLFLGTCG